MRWFICI